MTEAALLVRLGNGPASLCSLSRWFNLPRRVVQHFVARAMVQGRVVLRRGDRFDVPRAGRVVLRGYRWPTRFRSAKEGYEG